MKKFAFVYELLLSMYILLNTQSCAGDD
jgi:hypothetical protein